MAESGRIYAMIYLLYGEDNVKAREKMHNLVDSLRTKKPDASFFKIDSECFSDVQLEELIVGAGLFEQKYIVVLDKIFENKEAKEFVVKNIKEIGASENIFIILDGKLDKKTLVKLEKYSEKVQEFTKKEVKKEVKFNIFSLGDSFGSRKKKELWVLFQKALNVGISPEEIHGTLFWMTKSMILSKNTKTAKETGLNPFVFRKSMLFAKNFDDKELKDISSKLVSIYHEARSGGVELSVALEMFILSL